MIFTVLNNGFYAVLLFCATKIHTIWHAHFEQHPLTHVYITPKTLNR